MNYLLFLQNLRHACPEFITIVMELISGVVIFIAPLFAMAIYLSVDKKKGAAILFNVIGSNAAMNFLKVTFCVYRPWIRYPALEIAQDIDGVPTGYSFPSGHTTMATTFYGSLAIWHKKKRWLAGLFVFLILLTAFTRNWIGAHTLKDVLTAMVLGTFCMIVNHFAGMWLEKNPDRDKWILILILLVCLASGFYFAFKSYPTDYNFMGELIVDPVKMSKDAWQSMGMLSAWVISWFIERRFIKFDEGGSIRRRCLRAFLGCLIFASLYIVIIPRAASSLPPSAEAFLRMFVPVLVTACGYTALIKLVRNKI